MDQYAKTPNDDLICSYLKSFASGQPKQVAAHVTDDFVNQHLGLLGAGCETKVVYEQRLAKFLSGFENLNYEIQAVCSTPSQGSARYRMTFDQDGTSFAVPGMMWFEISSGKIAKRIDCWDGLTYLKQAKADSQSIAAML